MRRVERAAALAALLPCLLAGLTPRTASAAPVAAPASPGAVPEAAPEAVPGTAPQRGRQQVGLVLTDVTPLVKPNSRITVKGSVTNHSGQPMPGLTVRLRYVADAVGSRSQLDQYAAAPPANLAGVAEKSVRRLPQAEAPDGTQNWQSSLDPKVMGLRKFGVYPIGVEVVNAAQQVVAGITTFITYDPPGQETQRVRIGWVWPLAGRMHRANDQTFVSEQLNRDLAVDGRLPALVNAPAKNTKVPVTWAVDPALLDDLETVGTSDYRVKAPLADERTAARKPKNPAALTWLNSLKDGVRRNPYFTLPYADPDVVALTRHLLTDQLEPAYRNTDIAARILGKQPDAQYAWPAAGVAGPGSLNVMAQYGLKNPNGAFVLSERMFAPQNITTNALTTVRTKQGNKPVLTYDEKLNDIVSANVRAPGAAVLAQQRFIAETAMIALEAPSTPNRSLVVAPNRVWNPTPEFARKLLEYSGNAPWLKPASLADLRKTRPQPRAYQNYPDEFERYELGDTYLGEVRAIGRRARGLHAIMKSKTPVSYERALLRMQSASWRGHSTQARKTREELADELARDMDKVRVITSGAAMGGREGRIPITIVNDFAKDQKVEFLLSVTSENTFKFKVGEPEGGWRSRDLDGGEKETVWVPVQALGNGTHKLRITLLSADGKRRFGDPVTVAIRTTGYARTALLITGGGLAVLFVGVGVRAIRARRRRKAEAAGDGSTGMGPTATGPLEPGTPGAGSAGFWPSEPAGIPGTSGNGSSGPAAEPDAAAPVPGSPNGDSATGPPGPRGGRHRGGDGG
ncbi:DUF6049 family protein [Actinomadura kijaniata]|uniref:DUF6049 family protein n=1 Tax=Actinomadura kijaniata TaxID=46161 RepID=UPI0008347894|nr:DUF6049 family protein [Actinomadura kijaniata]